jgi:pimeloyl-ACP methyl ester carboxylesterase
MDNAARQGIIRASQDLTKRKPRMPSTPMGVDQIDVPTSRLRTHVLTAGPADAPVLVLVHGNVSSARFFVPTMSVLAGRFRCLAPDLRGFGQSEAAPVDARRGVRDFADDLHALLTESALVREGEVGGGQPRVFLLGWSLGGGVVMQYAIDHPGAVASIVLESPMSPYGFGGTRDLAGAPCWPDFAGSGGGTASPEMVRRIAGGDRGTDDPASPRNVLTTLYGQPPFPLPAGLEDELVGAMLQMATGDGNYPGDAVASPNWPGTAPGEWGVNNAISPKYFDVSGFAEAAGQPDVLWVRGDSDQIVSDTSAVDLGYLGQIGAVPGWPGVDLYPPQPMVGQMRAMLDRYRSAGGRYEERVLAGCGHSPHLEQPDEFNAVVGQFLAP